MNINLTRKNIFIKIFFAITICLVLLNGFVTREEDPEKLSGVSFDYVKKEISIIVVSNGCTQKSDFQFKIEKNNITIIRKKKDNCKAMPEPKQIMFSFKETGIDENKTYTIKNRFLANPELMNIR